MWGGGFRKVCLSGEGNEPRTEKEGVLLINFMEGGSPTPTIGGIQYVLGHSPRALKRTLLEET